MKTFEYLVLIPPACLLNIFFWFLIWELWYRKNYMTHESTPEHDKDWHRCWDCKKVESTMYFYNGIFGRVYRCLKCSQKHK